MDAGCYDCQSALDFIKKCPEYKKIYSMEPDPTNVEICRDVKRQKKIQNMEIIQKGLWSVEGELSFSATGKASARISDDGETKVEVTTIDDMYKKYQEIFTYIKMDIEGSELEALRGGERFIQHYHPKLAISVYHKADDIIEIFEYLHDIVPEYKFKIRHYTLGECDTVLYAFVDE